MSLTEVDFEWAPFLNVPLEDKERVKSLGARWNGTHKRWFVPKGSNRDQFTAWTAKADQTPSIRARAPFYVVESSEHCWKCSHSADVIALASEGYEAIAEQDDESADEFFMYHYVEYLPPRLAKFLRRTYPRYFIDYSNTTQTFYWQNHCECGASLGDFYLHHEPEHAFFPITEDQARCMKLVQLTSTGHIKLRAAQGTGPGYLIPRVATRIMHVP